MDDFDTLLAENRAAVESYVRYKLPYGEAEDVLQEIYLAAFRGFGRLCDPARFKPWIISIAMNKCRDFYRERAKRMEIPLESVDVAIMSRSGVRQTVRETLALLGDTDRQILAMYYLEDMAQADIAARLGIPAGTVKSRLHTARGRFREIFPYRTKGDNNMKLPEYLPEYTIERTDAPVFPVKWEEMMGWFLVPREGGKLTWGIWETMPGKARPVMTAHFEMAVTGRAEVHGIAGVEVVSTERELPAGSDGYKPISETERTFVVQLTDTHCRILSESHMEGGVKKHFDFLDGDAFLDNWGFGEDNIGNETDIRVKGDIVRSGSVVTTAKKAFLLDCVGRYRVTIGGRTHDTVCVMDVGTYAGDGIASEQFIDAHGRTVLWRRYNRDGWHGVRWSERLPENDRLVINGETYVHWYDCVTDYVM